MGALPLLWPLKMDAWKEQITLMPPPVGKNQGRACTGFGRHRAEIAPAAQRLQVGNDFLAHGCSYVNALFCDTSNQALLGGRGADATF